MNVRNVASRIDPGQNVQQRGSPPRRPVDQREPSKFADQLKQARDLASLRHNGITLSTHATQRIQQRGISLNPFEQKSLNEAMHQLEAKGARDALLLRNDAAFVVNIPSRTVVTAMGQGELQERVFTNIDSAMLV